MMTNIELEQAAELVAAGSHPLGVESVPVSAALGRTLAQDIAAPLDQPPFDRSPLDGYALRAADSTDASPNYPVQLTVVDTVYAGNVAAIPVKAGQAVRIMTGAMLPQGCDCILRQEDTDQQTPVVSIFKNLNPHDNCVDRGEDYRKGSLLLPGGTRLDASAIGLLASAGVSKTLPVRRRPRVLVISTGDEVVEPSVHPLPPGKIYDANLALLTARLAELGLTEITGRRVGDDPAALAQIIRQGQEHYDLILTTGGVSVGEKDIFHQVFPMLGAEQVFWRVKLKPGSPAMFSRYGSKPILSLSGNPFAAAATFELLGRPLLAALSGEPHFLPRERQAVLDTPFPKASPGRRFIRGRYECGRVTLPKGHASGVLSSFLGCNCMVDIPAGSDPLERGSRVNIILL